MGDIGALSAYMDRNGIPKTAIYVSQMCSLIMYYVMYWACYEIWTSWVFNVNISLALNDAYFFYISTIELMCFIFVRTRSSIKYLPKLITIANITFLMYVNSFMFGCQYEALGVL